MKKLITILISMVMVLGLAACANKTEPVAREEISAENTTQGTAENDAAATAENTVADDSVSGSADIMEETDETPAAGETDEAVETTDTAENENGAEAQGDTDTQGTKVLVAYFSATNTTEGVAERIANGLNADLYEITPEEPYTDADLNYNDNNSRTTIEMNDPDARPAISGSVEDMDQYTIVFIGYPNWWASIPMPIASFLEEYDFTGKTIIPFCSHGGGRFGQSLTAISKLAPDAAMGEALSIHYSGGSGLPDDVEAWLRTNGIIE